MGRSKRLALWGAVALLAGSAAASAIGSITEVAAASAISVFVGYADSERAGGEFPNPWNGAPNLTFDGCSPQAACTFDGGAIRIRNDNATPVSVDQVNVHIGGCLYIWSGAGYPVALGPGASLVTTQRASGITAGCTGPNPLAFDSSDIPSKGICVNDGILPTVDVTVDGTISSYTDSGQVLNTGGVDPGDCTGTDESTEWVKIGSKACPGQTLSLLPADQTDPVLSTATVTATFSDSCGNPLADVAVAFKVGAGPNSGATGSGTTDNAGNATFTYSSSVPGTDSLQAAITNAVGFTRSSNTATVTWTIEFAPGGGAFVIGNDNATLGGKVYFWGSQWAKRNSLTGGPAPRSFKGYAELPATPTCGQSWTSDPGNSTPPPDGPLPHLMGLIVTSSAHQTGSQISGDIVEIVLVETNPGYEPNPGHAATGTVVAVICGAAAATPVVSSQPPQRPGHTPAPASTPRPSPGAGPTAATCPADSRGRPVVNPRQACARKNRP